METRISKILLSIFNIINRSRGSGIDAIIVVEQLYGENVSGYYNNNLI